MSNSRSHSDRAVPWAVLGPTNTGKTHLAIERMLGHSSGMMGFPLRLLARENYDRVVAAKGADAVALITGEEKIQPANARYFLCTVEAMPLERPVAFLAIDEVQMCADPDRGHVFTERLLQARGLRETLWLGADTMTNVVRRLEPGVRITGRPRLSELTYQGYRNVTRLPPRTAVVAFSAADVYTLAELVRRHRGGAAVVLGALSPRTRNAQVAMYQAGEVDYLVATDAIGMGLNMDVDHVAFAATRKFDGRVVRPLEAAEMAQIAGRAGRHMNDGSFGVTAEVDELDPEMVNRLRSHDFPRLRTIFWRNPDLHFSSLAALQASLLAPPPVAGLIRARPADDQLALAALVEDPEVAGRADGVEAVRLLWEVCRIPDFGGVMSDAHSALLKRLYGHLSSGPGRLPTDLVARSIERLDRDDGDIEVIAQRIAHIRTWTYISNRAGWLDDANHWQERARAVEDMLSDALHDRLTQRFVDQRTSTLLRGLRHDRALAAEVDEDGAAQVEGHFVGHLEGFRFVADDGEGRNAKRAIASAAARALRGEALARLAALEQEPATAITLDDHGLLRWRNDAVGRLCSGRQALLPVVEPVVDDLLAEGEQAHLKGVLEHWLRAHVADHLAPLVALAEAELPRGARGLAYHLCEALGSLLRSQVVSQIEALSQDDRRQLRHHGVRIGRQSVYVPRLLKPAAARLCGLLWSVFHGHPVSPPPPPGRVLIARDPQLPADYYGAIGFRPLNGVALRLDMLERIAAALYELGGARHSGRSSKAFAITPELLSLAGASHQQMADILKGLGYRAQAGDSEAEVVWRLASPRNTDKPRQRKSRTTHAATASPRDQRSKRDKPMDPDSPFAVLKALIP